MTLPLSQLLNVSPKDLLIVVDNPRSPINPCSFRNRLTSRQVRRCNSSDVSEKSHRWLSVPPPLVGAGDTIASSHRRSRSLDDAMIDTVSSPVRIPNRYVSPPNSPVGSGFKTAPLLKNDSIDNIEKMSLPTRKLGDFLSSSADGDNTLNTKLCLAEVEAPLGRKHYWRRSRDVCLADVLATAVKTAEEHADTSFTREREE